MAPKDQHFGAISDNFATSLEGECIRIAKRYRQSENYYHSRTREINLISASPKTAKKAGLYYTML